MSPKPASSATTLSITTPSGGSIAVEVTRKRVKNLNLRVRSDGSVTLSAPARASNARIQDFLERHAAWICKHVDRQRELYGGGDISGGIEAGANTGAADAHAGGSASTPGSTPYAPGSTLPLWGRATPIEEFLGTDPAVLTVEERACAVRARYKQEIARVLPGIAHEAESRTGVSATRWSIRTMKTRWGSCTPKTGAIRINTQLAAYPPECLQMVVVHELVHLMEPSHNARFHALLDTYCPGNKAANRLLKGRPAQQAPSKP